MDFSRSVLFHRKTRVCLKHFAYDCMFLQIDQVMSSYLSNGGGQENASHFNNCDGNLFYFKYLRDFSKKLEKINS